MGTSIDMGSMNMEDSVSSVPDSSSSGEGFSERDEVAEIKKGASVQTRRVRTWRLIVTGVLLATGAVVSTLTYRLLLGGQVENYDDAVSSNTRTPYSIWFASEISILFADFSLPSFQEPFSIR